MVSTESYRGDATFKERSTCTVGGVSLSKREKREGWRER